MEERITVSRDALRADLAEMELRLRLYFDERLNHKADTGALAELALKFDRLDRGEFTEAHRRALDEFVDRRLDVRADAGWTRRERWAGIAATLIGVVSLALAATGGRL